MLTILFVLFVGLLPLASPAAAQVREVGEAVEQAADPYGRETPWGTVQGLLEAFASSNRSAALPFLDLSAIPEHRRAFEGQRLAARLQATLDRRAGLVPGSCRDIDSQPSRKASFRMVCPPIRTASLS
ncbi:MAG: hypothetical protein AAF311_12755 [Pseudomonadota bacterium]